MRPRRPSTVLSIGMIALLILAACAPEEDPTDPVAEEEDLVDEPDETVEDPVAGGELIFAQREEPDILDPTFAATQGAWELFPSMCESLYDVDEELLVVPRLAADMPELSDDGLTATIQIRDGVLFNDGTPLDAEAVKVSLDRHRQHDESIVSGSLEPIDEIVVEDDLTLRIELLRPFGPLVPFLAENPGRILSPTQLELLGDDFGEDPVCVGPFKFSERSPGDRIILERSEHYYDADDVFLDRVVVRHISESAVRSANVRAGDVHLAQFIPTEEIPSFEADPDFTVFSAQQLGYEGIYVNHSNASGRTEPPGPVDTVLAQHPEAREALELSLDRQAIVDVIFQGLYTAGCQVFSPSNPYFSEEVDSECLQRDVERAMEILDEIGQPNPTIEMLVRNDPTFIEVAELIQAMASEANINIELAVQDGPVLIERIFAGEFDTFQNQLGGFIDPDRMFAAHHSTTQPAWPMGHGEPLTDQDAQVNDLIAEGRATSGFENRFPIYEELSRVTNERRNVIPLYHFSVFTVGTSQVEGFDFNSDLGLRFAGVSLRDEG